MNIIMKFPHIYWLSLSLSLSHSLRNENLFMGFWENSWCLGHLFSLGNNLLTQIKKHTQLNSVLRTYFGCSCCFCLISSIFDKKNIRIVLREVNNESHVLRLVLSAYFSKHITHRRKEKGICYKCYAEYSLINSFLHKQTLPWLSI